MLSLSERIIEATEKKGLETFFIYGKFADGKTSYLLHVLYEVLGYLENLKDVDAWLSSLDHLFFNPLEGLVYVQVYQDKFGSRVPCIGMDDVGQHIPRARWWREDVVQFREWMTVARTDTAGIGFTAPTQLSLPGGIIDSCFLRIKVEKHKDIKEMSIAKGYEIRLSPMFQQICSGPVFIDDFPRRYPNFIYTLYEKMRKAMVSPLRRQLISMLGEQGAIRHLAEMGATQRGIGKVVGKAQQTISDQLKTPK